MIDWTDAVSRIDGKRYKLDDVDGTLHVYPSRRGYMPSVYHEASKIGRRSKAYRTIRRELGDDYDSDITQSERLVDIILEIAPDAFEEAKP